MKTEKDEWDNKFIIKTHKNIEKKEYVVDKTIEVDIQDICQKLHDCGADLISFPVLRPLDDYLDLRFILPEGIWIDSEHAKNLSILIEETEKKYGCSAALFTIGGKKAEFQMTFENELKNEEGEKPKE